MTMNLNLPNSLTLLRIGLIPVLMLLFALPGDWKHPAGALVFALAAVTDWLDGYLARRLNQISAFGAFLDPVADKLMVAVALVLLVQGHPSIWVAIPAVVIIGREIAISALREWMAELGKRAAVAVSVVGKFKTTAQMVAVSLLLYERPVGAFPTFTVGMALLLIAAALTLWSMLMYLRAAWPMLNPPKTTGSPRDGA